jgi:Gpi18-like mannosyltransferase
LKDIICISLVALILRILPVVIGADSTDINLYRQQALPVLNGQNIYQVTHKVFPYSPLTMFIPALCLYLSSKFSLPFHMVMKAPAILGDIAIAVAIYYWLFNIWKDRKAALRGAFLYAINPLAILICAFHGNIMSLPTLFSFLALIMMAYDDEGNHRLSALLLGLAIAFRGYAVLLLPFILLKSGISPGRKLSYVLYAILPTFIFFLPFLALDYRSVFREVFAYSGWTDYGFAAVARAWHSFQTGAVNYRITNGLVSGLALDSRQIFLAAYLIILMRYRRLSLLRSTVMVFLVFYFFYAGVASQYL